MLCEMQSIPERQDWFICSREPTICQLFQAKEVRPSMFGMPTVEVALSGKWHIVGCQADMPIHRTWGCCKCDAAFFKDTYRNIAALGGLFPHQLPAEKRTEKEKAKLMWKWFNEWKDNQISF